MIREIKLNGIGTSVVVDEKVAILNTTPHPITFQSPAGEVFSVPTSVIINAEVEEEKVDELFVKTVFKPTIGGDGVIKDIEGTYQGTGETAKLIIVGSIIAAQAYPGKVCGMTPVPGFERVPPAEKRMNCDKFTIF